MNACEIARLKEIAGKATPGPWAVVEHAAGYSHAVSLCHIWGTGGPGYGLVATTAPWCQPYEQQALDAAHIATFDSPTALALLTALEQSQDALAEADGRIAGLIEQIRKLTDQCNTNSDHAQAALRETAALRARFAREPKARGKTSARKVPSS